jgi:hypothetical protein
MMKAERGGHLSFLYTTDIYKVPIGSHSSLAIHLNQPVCERKSLQQGHIFHTGTQPDLFMSLSCLISISPSFQQQVLSSMTCCVLGYHRRSPVTFSQRRMTQAYTASCVSVVSSLLDTYGGLFRLMYSSASGKARHQKLQNTKS